MEEFDNQNQNNFNNYDYFPAFNNNIINTIQPENIEQNFVPFPENNIYINNNNSYTNEQFPEENIYINNNIDNNEYNILPTTISTTIPTAIPTTTISTTPSILLFQQLYLQLLFQQPYQQLYQQLCPQLQQSQHR